mgnify:CR=1 FL=1
MTAQEIIDKAEELLKIVDHEMMLANNGEPYSQKRADRALSKAIRLYDDASHVADDRQVAIHCLTRWIELRIDGGYGASGVKTRILRAMRLGMPLEDDADMLRQFWDDHGDERTFDDLLHSIPTAPRIKKVLDGQLEMFS